VSEPLRGSGSPNERESALVMADKVSKLYPGHAGLFARPSLVHAVDSASLYIRKGETLGLVGESGSGKSTLGRLLLLLSEPTLGRVFFDGVDITDLRGAELRRLRRRMQLVFQDPYSSLDPRMTVRAIVGEGIAIFKLARNKAESEDRVAAALRDVGLGADLLDRYPHELSGGQRQRVGIARALAVGPELLVCDEPVSALDVSVQAQIANLLTDLQERLSLAMLFISHDLRVVQWMSHRVAVMYAGRIVEVGPAKEIAERPRHPYTKALYRAAAPGRALAVLPGEPPSALHPPRGCAFHPRCERFERGVCDVEPPPLAEASAGGVHKVACYRPEEG
jgi:oligopeptide transport system ATP-binding protein